MSELMQALYSYAQEHLVAGYLHADEEYLNSRRCAGKRETKLRDALTSQLAKQLDEFLDEQRFFLGVEDEAAFRAGFVIAMELCRYLR